jgi:hypothetical protein
MQPANIDSMSFQDAVTYMWEDLDKVNPRWPAIYNHRWPCHLQMAECTPTPRGDLYDAQDVFRSFLFALILVPKPENLHP